MLARHSFNEVCAIHAARLLSLLLRFAVQLMAIKRTTLLMPLMSVLLSDFRSWSHSFRMLVCGSPNFRISKVKSALHQKCISYIKGGLSLFRDFRAAGSPYKRPEWQYEGDSVVGRSCFKASCALPTKVIILGLGLRLVAMLRR